MHSVFECFYIFITNTIFVKLFFSLIGIIDIKNLFDIHFLGFLVWLYALVTWISLKKLSYDSLRLQHALTGVLRTRFTALSKQS